MRHLSVSPVPNLGKTTQSPQNDLTPWILTLFKGKKKESMEDLLKKNSEWKNWKFNVEMKVAMIKEEGDEEAEEHSQILDVEIRYVIKG